MRTSRYNSKSFFFIADINDICNLSYNAKFITYADDTHIVITATNPDNTIYAANTRMSYIKRWVENKCLKTNTKRDKAALFIPVNRPLSTPVIPNICDHEVEFLNSIKSLGAIFSTHLTWDEHVNFAVAKLNRINVLLCKYRHTFPTHIHKLMYNASSFSHLTYCYLI